MIRYRLNCKDCDSVFDSWFASSKEYEKLKKLRHLDCNNCNSFNVEKTLMSPNVLNSKDKIATISKDKKIYKIKKKIKKYQKFIKENFNLSEIVSKLIAIRNIKIEEINLFLNPKIKNLLPNPFILKDMEKAVERTIKGLIDNEN